MVDGLSSHKRRDPNLLVGIETLDDAGIYKITDDIALVQTVDIITPVLDDPYIFGQIAAANSLSDVYAKGGKPINVLNICCFPAKGISPSTLTDILRGALSKVEEAGAVLVGGHTVKDDQLKFGLSVTGLINPSRIIRNSTAKVGDKLILTKPIGVGVLISGAKRGVIGQDVLLNAAKNMSQLNDTASKLMLENGANACTDVT